MTAKPLSRPLGATRVQRILMDISDAALALVETYPLAHEKLLEWSGPLASSGQNGRGSGHSDPTQRAAVAATDGRPSDQAGDMLCTRDAELLEVRSMLYALSRATTGILDSKIPDADPECEFCDRYGYYRRTLESAPAAGTDKPLIRRCDHHHEFLARYKQDGSVVILEYIAKFNRQPPAALIRQEHPALFAEYHGTNWARGGAGARR